MGPDARQSIAGSLGGAFTDDIAKDLISQVLDNLVDLTRQFRSTA